MPYTEENILNSQIALNVLREIAKSDEGAYTKQISDVLGSPETTISHIVKKLRELNMIERGRRTKAQFYEVNYKGISSYWFGELQEYAQRSPKPNYDLEVEDVLEFTEEHQAKIRCLAESFFEKSLNSKEHSLTLEQFLFGNFALSMKNYESLYNNEEEIPQVVKVTENLLMGYSNTPTYRRELLKALGDEDLI